MTKPLLEYSIVIPVYNGEPYLADLHSRLTDTFAKITPHYEIIFVDDASTDKSWGILNRLHQSDEKIKLIQLSKNFGQHNATLCGLKYSGGDFIITLDDDLQHPPEEIPKLIEEIQRGYSLVYGRYKKKKHSWFRNFCSALTNKILTDLTDNRFDLTSFRILKGSLAKAIPEAASPNIILDLWLMRVISKTEVSWCEVRHEESDTTHYNFFKLLQIAANIMLNHTVIPLRIATFLGILFSVISFALGFWHFGMYWFGHIDVSGFTTLVLLLTFFFGVLLFVLGIMGEYIAGLFLAVTQAPQYIVKQTAGELFIKDRQAPFFSCQN